MKKFKFEVRDGEGDISFITLKAENTKEAFARCHSILREDDDILTFETLPETK